MGGNNNPCSWQFKIAYKKMMVHLELRDSFLGNWVLLETIPIMTPWNIINKSCGKERIAEVEEDIDIK